MALLGAIDLLPDVRGEELPGVYLEIKGRPNEPLTTKSLDASGLSLLKSSSEPWEGGKREIATVFATADGLDALRKKVEQFQTEDMPDRTKDDGQILPGRPKNANLVQSLAAIAEAGLRALWRSPPERFPQGDIKADWEIWLDPPEADDFIAVALLYGVEIGSERLHFPEDIVVTARASHAELADAVRNLGSVRALAVPSTSAEFFDGLPVEEQALWTADLAMRANHEPSASPGYVTLLDTGVSRAHPLLQPALLAEDRHAANPAWGLEDVKGHGSQLAGLALYGDLTPRLADAAPVLVRNRLESVKLLPDAGGNPHHLLGSVTRKAIDAVEVTSPRRRTYTMASTTSDDSPHDGAPTSWSSEVDQLAAGVSGARAEKRLILVSAGNTNNFEFGAGDYLATCDHVDNELESPAQAWNALSVGAYTEKTTLPPGDPHTALAPMGDLSPASRTASWSSQWPLKPDIVLEGGNWALGAAPPPMRHGALSLLTTHNRYPERSFDYTHDTSAATALAAKEVTELWSDYPTLWPETIRALYVSSARWTPRMKSHLPPNPPKGSYAPLFRRYGYGVPDLMRARRSASNALTLVLEDTIRPYSLSESGGDSHNEMKLFTLPWPVEELRKLKTAQLTLRVSLSSFIAPNPSETARGSRYRYASHNLRFKLNRADEKTPQFMARISKLANKPEILAGGEGDNWTFGSDRRDVGSLHIDELTCKASDLARRNLIAVHPVTGWWKSKSFLRQFDNEAMPTVRFALIVEIDAGEIEVDLYAEVSAAIAAVNAVKNPIVT